MFGTGKQTPARHFFHLHSGCTKFKRSVHLDVRFLQCRVKCRRRQLTSNVVASSAFTSTNVAFCFFYACVLALFSGMSLLLYRGKKNILIAFRGHLRPMLLFAKCFIWVRVVCMCFTEGFTSTSATFLSPQW